MKAYWWIRFRWFCLMNNVCPKHLLVRNSLIWGLSWCDGCSVDKQVWLKSGAREKAAMLAEKVWKRS